MTDNNHDMNACCALCHDPLDLVTWQHPETGEKMDICSFCARSIIGTCATVNSAMPANAARATNATQRRQPTRLLIWTMVLILLLHPVSRFPEEPASGRVWRQTELTKL